VIKNKGLELVKNLVILGDSLALPRPERFQTYNPNESLELAVEFQDTYGYLLQMALKDEFYIINRAARSTTIKIIYDRDKLDHIFLLKPDVIVLHVGIVDVWLREELGFKSYLNADEFEHYYRLVFDAIKKLQATRTICIGICPTSIKMDERHPGLLEHIRIFNGIIRALCQEKGSNYIDMTNFINQENLHDYLLLDDHHLNKSGNLLVYSEIMRVLTN
jgi:lysophospholipase L1-like esterase